MAIIENMVQGSEQWHAYRRAHIMATDASIITSTNPFKNMLELWEEKLQYRPAQLENDAMRRGTLLEPEARALASQLIGIDFQPCVYESDEYPWMAASLDGLTPCGKYILEIKCPKEKTHMEALEGVIPEYYKTQMFHQLACTKANKCVYYSYRPGSVSAIIYLDYDQEYIQSMIPQLYDFYQKLMTEECPVKKFKAK